jgi:hypothetical protein
MVDGFHIHIQNLTMKPLAIALSVAGRGLGEDGGGYPTNVQCKTIWNCHNESFLYNKYFLMKMEIKE